MSEYNGETSGSTELRPAENPAAVDYFSFGGTQRFMLPDGIQWIEFKIMNEGQRAKYQRMTKRDLVMGKTGDTRVGFDLADDRHALILCAVTNWSMKRGSNTAVFSERSLRDFLEMANPSIIDDLESAIRKANKWLNNDLSVQDIDDQIRDLQEQRAEALRREAGESSSSSR